MRMPFGAAPASVCVLCTRPDGPAVAATRLFPTARSQSHDDQVTSSDGVDNPHDLAQRALLNGLRRGERLDQLQRAVRQTTTKGFTPDIAVLELAVLALHVAGVGRHRPLLKTALVTEHLSELNFRNQRTLQERTTYTINLVAAIHGGLEPDVLDDTYRWGTTDIVDYAVIAATAYLRACAQRQGQPLPQFIDELQRALAADR
jgi:hypothetical protein